LRSIVLSGVRTCLVAFLSIGLLNLPVMAASEKPLGIVVTSTDARLDNASATVGANVYSDDALTTEQSGSLRLKVGPSQIYLLASSSAKLEPLGNKVRAKVEGGTVGFSTTAPDQIEIGTPLGVIRGANGQRVFGQVAVLNASTMRVSAYEGTLLVEAANGDVKAVGEGETYEATLAPALPGAQPQNRAGVGGSGVSWKRVAVVGAILGGTAIAAALAWDEATESCSQPSCDD